MPDQILDTEYVEINGVPLSTPAWRVVSLDELFDAGGVRGEDRIVPYFDGAAISVRRWLEPKRFALPLIVFGEKDREGTAYANARDGLIANMDALKKLVARPKQTSDAGTYLLKHHLRDGSIREGQCHVLPPFALARVSPVVAKGVLDVVVPEGVLRSPTQTSVTSASVADGATGTLTVPNVGTADQYAVILELTGTASTVKISNVTWDAAGDTWLQFGGTLGTLTKIDAGKFTADRDGTSVVGLITHSGHERWMPLAPGDNTLEIRPTGGTATLTVKHFPAYL